MAKKPASKKAPKMPQAILIIPKPGKGMPMPGMGRGRKPKGMC